MKVAVIYNKVEVNDSDVINILGRVTREHYDPRVVENVASALEKGGHNVRIIEGNMGVIDDLRNFMPRVVTGERPGMVFNMAYGIQGQSRYTHIPALLEMLGIPYVGSSPSGHAVALDKVLSKMVFLQHQLPTPKFWLLSSADQDTGEVSFPAIVKPKMEAVSYGIRVVHNYEQLREAVDLITREFQQQALVEEFIPGREFNVGLLGNGAKLETLPILEIDFGSDPNGFQTLEDKLIHPRGKICPAQVTPEVAENLRALARKAFESLGLADFSRVDFRMDAEGNLQILEINSMASLNLRGSFVQAARVSGLDFSGLVNRILNEAAVRYFGEAVKSVEEKTISKKKGDKPLNVRVRRYLRNRLPAFVDTLQKMVAINSFTHNKESVDILGNRISRDLGELEFSWKIHPQVDVGDILYFSNHSEKQNDILILGHLDTAYDHQNYVSFYEEHGKIMGSGVAESKGGLAVILAALRALHFAGALKKIRCAVLLTSDDTLGGPFSRKLIEETAQVSKYVVGTKFCDREGGIVTSCAGSEEYNIVFTNFKSPGIGSASDLISVVCQKTLALRKLNQPKKGTTVKISSLIAQKNPGQTSDLATIVMAAGYLDTNRIAKLDKRVREIVGKGSNSRLQAQIRVGMRRPPIVTTKASLEFFEKVQSLGQGLEVRVIQVHREASSDICHVPAGIPVLGGFGPIGGNRRSPHEFIIRDSIIDRSALLALVIYDSRK